MFKKFLNWLQNNKLTAFLFFIIFLLLFKNSINKPKLPLSQVKNERIKVNSLPVAGGGEKGVQLSREKRLVIKESNISLVVNNVREKLEKISAYVNRKKGYVVSSSLTQPQEQPFATLVIRIPTKQLKPTLNFLRKISVKVISENISGRDITDEYFDLEARLKTLSTTKEKLEKLLSKTDNINQIIQIQRELMNLQEEIDRLKGYKQYLEKSSETAKITIYLSTDELSLPYSPQIFKFRPKVVFKQAVRSLVINLRRIGVLAIWIGVYSVLWLPALFVFYIWKKRNRLRT